MQIGRLGAAERRTALYGAELTNAGAAVHVIGSGRAQRIRHRRTVTSDVITAAAQLTGADITVGGESVDVAVSRYRFVIVDVDVAVSRYRFVIVHVDVVGSLYYFVSVHRRLCTKLHTQGRFVEMHTK